MARILLVEDEELVAQVLCRVIEGAGHAADCARTRREAEALLATTAYRLVVADMRLPDGRGQEIAAKAAALGIEILLMTGHPDDAHELREAEIDHLLKPFRLDEFERIIARYTDGHQHQD